MLDGDRGTQTVDGVYIGALHLVKELAGVGGKRLHVTALPLGVNGVEGQGGFAGSAESGDDSQGVTGNFNINVFEVMLARPAHRNLGNSHTDADSNAA